MKNRTKIIATIMAAAMLILTGCASAASQAQNSAPADTQAATETTDAGETTAAEAEGITEPAADTAASGGQTFKVGICNYVDDASLNQIVENIENQLKTLGDENGVNFEIMYDNCNADANVMSQIIANFIADEADLMVGVATPVAMAMQSATEENQIPVVFAAVSDPVACGVVSSMENPGYNITGTSDYLDTKAVMNLIFAANPDAKKIGLLYDAGQDASTTAIADAKAYLEDKGTEYVERTGTNVSEVQLAVSELVADQVDAVFTPSDNTIMQAELSIYETLAEAKIPHYTGADSFALNGAFLGYGVDYANLGVETANMVCDILVNGKGPATYPVQTFDNGTATINTETCAAIGFDLDTVSKAFEPFCTKIETLTTAESFE
ncbi:MAG: ABC transporter substrate-binding protein [Lachnospiraceae bacterium]|nr:ABC transporter substrate-binding protein [Lachnospiraceae bacterium]